MFGGFDRRLKFCMNCQGTMFLIYTDEAGNTGCKKDPDQPIHMIGALIVHAEQVRPINDAVSEILKRFAPEAENHEVQQPVIRAMRDFQSNGWRFGGAGKPMKRIIDTVHFVRSIDNRVLQLADLVTYLLCKAQRLRDSIRTEPRGLKASEELILRLDRRIRQRLVFS